jgi:hypothetical protein
MIGGIAMTLEKCAPIVACALAAYLIGCDFIAIHRGRVVACGTQKPIEGAVVQLTDRDDPSRRTTAQSKPDGAYVVAVPGGGDMHQLVAASGYRADERDLPRTSEDVPTDVCLAPNGP